jgi:hypothetical protein
VRFFYGVDEKYITLIPIARFLKWRADNDFVGVLPCARDCIMRLRHG